MTPARWTMVGMFALLMAACSDKPQVGRAAVPAPPKPPVILVFADITDSLQGGEATAVQEVISYIFDRAPEKTLIRVYPVLAVPDIARELSSEVIPFRTATGAYALKKDADRRAEFAKHAVDALLAVGKTVDPRVPSSCLSGALRRAANDLNVAEFSGRPLEVVIISDMVEDCRNSINGSRVALVRAGITGEIAAARKLTSFVDLQKANVFFIYPAAVNSGSDPNRKSAPPKELQAFW